MTTHLAAPDLAAWALSRLPELIDTACDAVHERIAFYRDTELVTRDELAGSVESNLRSLIAAVGDGAHPLDPAAARATGRRRAQQGAPLPEVLRAYRLTFVTLWDGLVGHVRSLDGTANDALLTASSTLWLLSDEHAVALTEGYRAATAELLLAGQRRRTALVEALLSGQPSPDAGPWEAAALLGLPPDGLLVVVAADTSGLAQESLPGIESRLAEQGIVSAWRLTPAQQLGVISLQATQRAVMLAELERAVLARTGVSPSYTELADTPRALRLAHAAQRTMPPGVAGVHTFSDRPLAALVVREPTESRRLAQRVLGGVLQLPSEDRTTLIDTLESYLDHGGSAERAGQALFCHPNTVRYRLRRLQELSGRSLTDPRDVAELATAVDVVRLDGGLAGLGGAAPDRRPSTDPA